MTFSGDTTILCVCIFVFFHFLSHNYWISDIKVTNLDVVKSISSASLISIFFAGILLSSRLHSTTAVFVLVFQNLFLFGYGPYIRILLNHYNRQCYDWLAIFSTIYNFVWMFMINHIGALIYLLSIGAMALFGPLLFIYTYKEFKNDIRGPWDLPNVK